MVSKNLKTRQVQKFKETEIGKIPINWKVDKIENFLSSEKGSIKIGPFGSQIKREFFVSEGIKVYGQENIFKNNFSLGSRYITNERFEMLSSCELKPNDLIISMMGTIGFMVIVPKNIQKGIMDSHLLRIRIDENKINNKFLLYALRSPIIQNQIDSLSVGTIMPGLNSKIIKQLFFQIPKLSEQEKIAKILSDLDTKIDNLQNQNEVLEQTTQAIFKSWFVDFDGITEFEDSELGQIPKGWGIRTIGELVNHQKGFVFKSSDYQTHGKRIIRITNLTKDSIDLQNCIFIDEKKVQEQKYQSVILNENDILITTVGSNLNHPESAVGRPIRVPTFAADSLLNQNMVRLRCIDPNLQLFLLQNIIHPKFIDYLSARTQGSANQASITLDVIFDYAVVLPVNGNFLKNFSIISESIYKKINKNQIQIQSLTKTRDILLPKLMSGEIRV